MIDTSGTWVNIVFVQGDDFDGLLDECEHTSHAADNMAAYLSQWDYGQETDDAHTGTWQAGSRDDLYEVNVEGQDYVISLNLLLGYASLSRRPLN